MPRTLIFRYLNLFDLAPKAIIFVGYTLLGLDELWLDGQCPYGSNISLVYAS